MYEELDHPIIGYNVIEEVVNSGEDNYLRIQEVKTAFPNIKDADALVTLIKGIDSDYMCTVKTTKKDILIPKGTNI